MHLIVPFAGTVSEAGRHALQSLALPRLEALLARWSAEPPVGRDEYSLNPPHEQALAAALGWPAGPDAALPWAARRAVALGLPGAADAAWALLQPVNLQVGSDQVGLTAPDDLRLDAAHARALCQAVAPLFDGDGGALHFDDAGRWLARHPMFDGLATASLDRVAGRGIDPWLPDVPTARGLRRLQNEVQMTLHEHPANEAREAAGLPAVNSVWISGCGRLPTATAPAPAEAPTLDDRLRAPALAEDWAAWCEAWRALDAGPIDALGRAGAAGRLTLCGERRAQAFAPAERGLWARLAGGLRRPSALAVLEAL